MGTPYFVLFPGSWFFQQFTRLTLRSTLRETRSLSPRDAAPSATVALGLAPPRPGRSLRNLKTRTRRGTNSRELSIRQEVRPGRRRVFREPSPKKKTVEIRRLLFPALERMQQSFQPSSLPLGECLPQRSPQENGEAPFTPSRSSPVSMRRCFSWLQF